MLHHRDLQTKTWYNDFVQFIARWMKTQPAGYRDFDRWSGRYGLRNGEAALVEQLHFSLSHWRGEAIASDAYILDLYRDAEYSHVPVTRITDARLPGLRSARQFQKAYGMQVKVYSNEHPPPHIHVGFLDTKHP